MNILIIGGGNMGNTFAQSFLAAHIIRPNALTILESNPDRVAYLKNKHAYGGIETEPGAYIADADLVVLAVKPQNTAELFPNIYAHITSDTLVLSIMAGVTLKTLADNLSTSKIIRAMPNLPAQVGMGMTAFTARPEVSRRELIEVQNLLSTTGRAIYFDDENMIDAATAISGSGPAYVFFFMDAMIDAAMQIGFNESQSELLVWQTFMGAMHLHNKNKISCEEWIKRVSSKGGTTEAAVKVFRQNEVKKAIGNGIFAALKRSEELGK